MPPYLPEAHRQNEVVIDAIVATVATYARGGYDVVVDGIIGPWFLAPFRAARDDWAMSYVVLRPSLATSLSRAKQRPDSELKDVEAITGLHGAFAQLDDLEHHAIDTSRINVQETVIEVRRAVASGNYRLD